MTAGAWRWSVAVLCALAFAVRLTGLNTQSLWYDEAFSLLVANRAPLEIIAATARDNHPPLFYLIQWLWSWVGQGEFLWRFPWAVAGTLTVPFTAVLGRRTVGPPAALFGALLVAVAPFLVFYSQEVRMYALLCLTGVATVYAWQRLRDGGGAGWWLLGWLSATAALYTHVMAALTLAALAATLWLPGRRSPAAAMLAAAVVAALPWAYLLPQQVARVQASFWYDAPTALSPLVSLYLFLYAGFLPAALRPVGLALVLVTPALAVPALRKRRVPSGVLLLAAVLALPVLAALAVSIIRPLYLERTLIVGVPAWCLLLGWSLTRIPLRPLAVALGVGLLVMSAVGTGRWLRDPAAGKPPYRDAAGYVAARWVEGDAIVHTADSSLLPFLVYLPSRPQSVLDGNPAVTPESVRGWALYSILPFPPTPLAEAGAGARRVWLVVAPDYNAAWQLQAAADYAQGRSARDEWQRGGVTVRLLLPP